MGSRRLTAKECLAVLEERINNLTKRFDKFEESQQVLVDRVIKNMRSINDLSHSVKMLMDEREAKMEIDRKWKFLFASSSLTFLFYVILEIVKAFIL
ncbi:MAG: hypothetical protein DRP01_00895 [Archaeoglobales archaeon]|nr:MAG: hypothetical protein DRP01_00895 [Archaeoglobales archaeon]